MRFSARSEGLPVKFNVFVLFLLSTGALSATTPGWENFNPNRREVAPAKIVWQANFKTTTGFSFERCDGAEGRIAFSDGTLKIEKTNDPMATRPHAAV